jgi:FkbM family methyltransferase
VQTPGTCETDHLGCSVNTGHGKMPGIARTVRTVGTSALQRAPVPIQQAVVEVVRAGKRVRRRGAEALGSDRYSRPALNDLERKLARYLPRVGVFVEAGANDGFRQSNTYHLERFEGWTGLLVEPIPELAARARRERRSPVANAALVAFDYDTTTVSLCTGGLQSIVRDIRPQRHRPELAVAERIIEVPARTLSSLLDEYAIAPTFISLDVEGYEPQALAGLDLARHAPDWMLVECFGTTDAVAAVIGAAYAQETQLSTHDYLYRRR